MPLTLENYDAATMGLSTEVPVIPKNVAAGNRTLNFGGMIWLEKDDAVRIELGEEVYIQYMRRRVEWSYYMITTDVII